MNIKKAGPPALLIIFGAFIAYQIFSHKQEIENLQLHFSNLNLLLLMISLLLVYLVNVLSWHMLTLFLGLKVGFGNNAKIWLVSNLARFIPGGVFQYPSRVVLLSRAGVPKALAAKAVIFEILFTLMAGCLISLISLNSWNLPQIFFLNKIYFYIFGLVVFVLILALSLGLADKIIYFGAKLRGKSINSIHLKFPPLLILPVVLVFSLRFVVTGLVLYFILQGLVGVFDVSVWEVVGKFSLSWIVGYLAFFSPGGLGVMEATLTGLLSANVGIALAGVSAIAFRILLLISEFIFVLVFNYTKSKQIKEFSYEKR